MAIKKIEDVFYLIAIKINDHKIYHKLFSIKSTDTHYYVFQNNEYNQKVIQSCFSLCLESFEAVYYDTLGTIKRNEIFDLLINENDYYIDSLQNIVNSKYFPIIDKEFNHLTKKTKILFNEKEILLIEDNMAQIHDNMINYKRNKININELIKILILNLTKNVDEFKKMIYSKEDSNSENNFWRQIFIFKKGFFKLNLNLILFLKEHLNLINEKEVENVFDKILDLINVFFSENPFLISILFNPNVFKVFNNEKTNLMITTRCYDFYSTLVKKLNYYKYKIKVDSFLSYFFPINTDFLNKPINEINKILKFLIDLLHITEEKSFNDVNNHIGSIMEKLLDSAPVLKHIDEVLEILKTEKKSKNEIIINVYVKIRYKLIKNICQILNKLTSENFIIATQIGPFASEKGNNLFLTLLRNINTSPKLRIIITTTYLNYNYVYHYGLSSTRKIEKKSKIDKNSEIIIELLLQFPEILKFYYKIFATELEFFFDYFLSTIHSLFKISTYSLIFDKIRTIQTDEKSTIFRICLNYLQCYQLFLSSFYGIYLDKNHIDYSFINNYLKIDQEVYVFLGQTIDKLKKDINDMKDEYFPHFETEKILNIVDVYTKRIFNKKQSFVKQEIDNVIMKGRGEKFMKIINSYKAKKINFKNENYLHSLFSEKNENSLLPLKKCIITSLLSKFEKSDNHNISRLSETNSILFESICKLFKTDPIVWQNYFMSNRDICKELLSDLIKNQFVYLIEPIYIEYNKLECVFDNSIYDYYCKIIEFIRLLCEDHNSFFQTLIIHFPVSSDKSFCKSEDIKNNYGKFLELIVLIWINIGEEMKIFSKKKNFIKFFNDKQKYFNRILYSINELLIEIFQGTYDFNFEEINFSRDIYKIYLEKEQLNLNEIGLNDECEFKSKLFFKFLNSYIEENKNKNKKIVLKKINPKQLVFNIIFSMKKVYINYFDDGKNKKPDDLNIPIGTNLKFNEFYLTDEDFIKDNSFELAINMFTFIKLCSQVKGERADKYKKIIRDIDSLKDDNDLTKLSKEMIGKREIFIFLNKLSKSIEISYQMKSNSDITKFNSYQGFFEGYNNKVKNLFTEKKEFVEIKQLKNIIFIVDPLTMFLTRNDINNLFINPSQNSFNEKLDNLLKEIPRLENILRFRRFCWKKHFSLYFLSLLDFKYIEYGSAIFAILTNSLLLFTLPNLYTDSVLNKSILYSAYVHLIYLFIFIVTFLCLTVIRIYFNLFLDTNSSENSVEKIFYREFLMEMLSFKIILLLFNFFVGIIAILSFDFYFLFSLQLFIIWNFFDTMKSAIFSVKLRSSQFMSTTILLLILVLLFSSLSFYYFQKEYYSNEIDVKLD